MISPSLRKNFKEYGITYSLINIYKKVRIVLGAILPITALIVPIVALMN